MEGATMTILATRDFCDAVRPNEGHGSSHRSHLRPDASRNQGQALKDAAISSYPPAALRLTPSTLLLGLRRCQPTFVLPVIGWVKGGDAHSFRWDDCLDGEQVCNAGQETPRQLS